MLRLLPALVLLPLCLLPLCLSAAPLRILSIGDSLTEEYAFEFPFSVPAVGQPVNHARNWPEILSARRPEQVSFGEYDSDLAAYSDYRNGGYSLNFGIPGFTADDWANDILPAESLLDGILEYRTREALIDDLPTSDVVVIFLGGNDLKSDYDDLYNGTATPGFFNAIGADLASIHDFVRQRHPTKPIVVTTLPDVGATPDVAQTFNDPAKAASARSAIAAFNQVLVADFEARSHTAVARIDRLIDRIFDTQPFQLNGTIFTVPGDPDNPPDHVFCKDDFHPNTVAQALIANEILAAMERLGLGPLTPIPHREILSELLLLDPDKPYLDYIGAYPVADDGPDEDPDEDGYPNLIEMALGSRPDRGDEPDESGEWRPGGGLSWVIREPESSEASRYLRLTAWESQDLESWIPLPPERFGVEDGSLRARPAAESPGRSFFRLMAEPRP